MKKSLSSVICLTVISLVITGVLAIVNEVTAPVITANEKAAAFAALAEVLPGGSFSSADVEVKEISDDLKKIGVVAAYKEDNGGCVVTIETAGYSTGLKLMFGVSSDGKITGSTCLASGETLGYEKTYGDKVLGADLASIDGIDTVSGATKTTTAYRNAGKAAIQAATILAGGSVDTRSEAEILNDTLNEYLGTTGATFTEWFKSEDLGSVEKAYVTDAGYGFISDGKFAAVKADGTVAKNDTALSEDDLKKAYALIKSSSLTDVAFTGLDISDRVTAVSKSSTAYVLTVNAAGWGKNGNAEYGRSEKFFVVKVAVSFEGKVLDCEVLEQYETDGVGSVCSEKSFGTKYVGSTAETISGVDAQAGVTFTSNGYKAAVKNAIDATLKLKEAGK